MWKVARLDSRTLVDARREGGIMETVRVKLRKGKKFRPLTGARDCVRF